MICSIQLIPVNQDPHDVYVGSTLIEAIKNCLDCIATGDEEWRDVWLAQTLPGMAEFAQKIVDGETRHTYRYTDMDPNHSFDMVMSLEDDDDEAEEKTAD